MLLVHAIRDVISSAEKTGHEVEAAFMKAVRLQMSEFDNEPAPQKVVDAEDQFVVHALRAGLNLQFRIDERDSVHDTFRCGTC